MNIFFTKWETYRDEIIFDKYKGVTMGDKLLEIREMMDKVKKMPLLQKATTIERIANKQYELMEMLVMEVEKCNR